MCVTLGKSLFVPDSLTEVLWLLLWNQDFDTGHGPLQESRNNRLYPQSSTQLIGKILPKIYLIVGIPRLLQIYCLWACHLAESSRSYMSFVGEIVFLMFIFNNKLIKVSECRKLCSSDDEWVWEWGRSLQILLKTQHLSHFHWSFPLYSAITNIHCIFFQIRWWQY